VLRIQEVTRFEGEKETHRGLYNVDKQYERANHIISKEGLAAFDPVSNLMNDFYNDN
jgi:hypothetical protein